MPDERQPGSRPAPVLVAIYFGTWIAIGAGVVWLMARAGLPTWAGILAAVLLFQLGNTLLGYWARHREARRNGTMPPSLLAYATVPTDYRQEVRVSRLTRILLGLVIVPGGLVLLLASAFLLSRFDGGPRLPIGGWVFGIVVALSGAGMVWVGIRLLVMKDGEYLLAIGQQREHRH